MARTYSRHFHKICNSFWSKSTKIDHFQKDTFSQLKQKTVQILQNSEILKKNASANRIKIFNSLRNEVYTLSYENSVSNKSRSPVAKELKQQVKNHFEDQKLFEEIVKKVIEFVGKSKMGGSHFLEESWKLIYVPRWFNEEARGEAKGAGEKKSEIVSSKGDGREEEERAR